MPPAAWYRLPDAVCLLTKAVSPCPALPAEFAAAGSLASHLRSGVGFIPLRQRAQLALHAVNGMAYLHSLKVRPCAAAPQRPLLRPRPRCCVGLLN